MTLKLETSTPLAAAAVYTSPGYLLEGAKMPARIRMIVSTDQASAASGLRLEFSNDGTTWPITGATGTAAAGSTVIESLVLGKFVRAKYTNGATLQGSFTMNIAFVQPGGTIEIVSMTQAAYDALAIKDPSTLYVTTA